MSSLSFKAGIERSSPEGRNLFSNSKKEFLSFKSAIAIYIGKADFYAKIEDGDARGKH